MSAPKAFEEPRLYQIDFESNVSDTYNGRDLDLMSQSSRRGVALNLPPTAKCRLPKLACGRPCLTLQRESSSSVCSDWDVVNEASGAGKIHTNANMAGDSSVRRGAEVARWQFLREAQLHREQ